MFGTEHMMRFAHSRDLARDLREMKSDDTQRARREAGLRRKAAVKRYGGSYEDIPLETRGRVSHSPHVVIA